jgi:hypothetical protein
MVHPDLTFTVDVGYTAVRPIVVDQKHSEVTVLAETTRHAEEMAHAMCLSRQGVEMVTSTTIMDVVA